MLEMREQYLHFRDAYISNEKLFFSAVEMNGLFYRKRNESTAKFIARFPGENQFQSNLHSQIIEYGGKLYFIPLNGKGVSFYDLNNLAIETIPYEGNRVIEIIKAFLINTDILLLPLNSKTPFLIFHTKNNTYERLQYIEDEISKVIKKEKIWIDTFSAIMENEVLYLALPGTDILVKCDLNNHSVKIKKLENGFMFNAVTYSCGRIYMSTMNCPDLIEYNINDKRIKRICKKCEDRHENIVTLFKGEIYVISSKSIKVLDENQKCVMEIKVPKEFSKRSNNYRLLAGWKNTGKSLWLFSASGCGTLKIKNKKISLIETVASPNIQKQITYFRTEVLNQKIKEYGYIVEKNCEETHLERYVDLILYDWNKYKRINKNSISGNFIYKYLKEN